MATVKWHCRTTTERLVAVNRCPQVSRWGRLQEQYQPRVVAWDMSAVPDIEYSALQALIDGEKNLSERGTMLWLADLNPGVMEMVRHAGLSE